LNVLGEQPILGRGFRQEDGTRGSAPVALISHRLWSDRYAGASDIVGRTIRINGVPTTVIGVMRDGFRFPILSDVWQPLGQMAALALDQRAARTLGVFGRLGHGTTLAEARAELAGIAAALADEYPDSNAQISSWIVPFTQQFAGRSTDAAPLMMALSATIVLLIACANAASVLLSRSVPRVRELSLRAAMGASRWRLVRQLLVESFALAALAGGLGLVLSRAGVGLFTRETADFNLPYWMDFSIDLKVFAFLAVACGVTTCLCGLMPAWQLGGVAPGEVLKDAGRGLTPGRRARRWSGTLLVGELALTLTLLSAAGLLLRSASALFEADALIDTSRLLTARFSLPASRYSTDADRVRFNWQVQTALDNHPVIASATIANTTPFIGSSGRQLIREGASVADDRQDVGLVLAGDHYFETLGIAVLRGRDFSGADSRAGQEGAIINDRLATRLFGGGDPIGQRVRVVDGATNAPPTPWLTIVGVSPAIRQAPASEAGMVIYVPLALQPPAALAIIARGRNDGAGLAAALRQELMLVDPDVALYNIAPLERVSQQSRWIPRAMSTALTIAGTMALVLSALGLYGTTSYAVAQRTAEVGIRVALGAQRGQVRWLFLRGVVLRVIAGAALGLIGSIAVGRLLSSVVTRSGPMQAATIAAAIGLLAAVAVVATLVPARRATRMDPVAALRHE
jgi:putative ABC transport system permease protein